MVDVNDRFQLHICKTDWVRATSVFDDHLHFSWHQKDLVVVVH